ncbi:MAG: acyl-CoA dehydrogenase family protein, partial [Chloroflexota bacterium]
MDFEYTDEQKMFRKLARDFVERHVMPNAREIDREDRFPTEWLKEMVPLGFLGITVPAEYGGLGVDRICYCVVVEELARGSAAASAIVGVQNSFAETPILEWGTPEQRQKYIPRMVKGEVIGCLASTEPNHGSDPASMETSAARHGNGWLINGSKMFITNGTYAQIATTAAQTDRTLRHKGIVAFVVEQGTPGFTAKKVPGKLGMK